MNIEVMNKGDKWKVESTSEKGKFYMVEYDDKKELVCSCPANVKCKHIKEIENMSAPDVEKEKPTINESAIIWMTRGGVEAPFVLYKGLLDIGHQIGIKHLHAELIQIPHNDNGLMAICKSYLEFQDGRTFRDIGDADPGNVKGEVKKAIIRMASTRALARALRSGTNVGITCYEELGGSDKKDMTKSDKSGIKTNTLNEILALLKVKGDGFQSNQKYELRDWLLERTFEQGEKIKDIVLKSDTFDYNSYITLKDEVRTEEQLSNEQ